jgi:hypothetical protein
MTVTTKKRHLVNYYPQTENTEDRSSMITAYNSISKAANK